MSTINTNQNKSLADNTTSDHGVMPTSDNSKDLVDSTKDYVSGDSSRSSSSHRFGSKNKKF